MQDLGFALTEISKLLGAEDKDGEWCNDMYNFVVNKIEKVQTKIRGLKRIEQILFNIRLC
jgi:MerR family mercuric resistance operon transcriptional regulator